MERLIEAELAAQRLKCRLVGLLAQDDHCRVARHQAHEHEDHRQHAEKRRDREDETECGVADHAAGLQRHQALGGKGRDRPVGAALRDELGHGHADGRHQLEAVAREAEDVEHAGRAGRRADDGQQVGCLRLQPRPGACHAHPARGREDARRRRARPWRARPWQHAPAGRRDRVRPCRPPPISKAPRSVCLNDSDRPRADMTGFTNGSMRLGHDHHRAPWCPAGCRRRPWLRSGRPTRRPR